MTRIFLALTSCSTLLLIAAFVLGLSIGDPTARDAAVQLWVSYHILTALAGLVFASLVHALFLTYFMGTGRWMEETAGAYSLPNHWRRENQSLKYRILLAISGAFVLLLATGAFGTAADPASPVGFQGWAGLSAATIHLLLASITVAVNLLVNVWELQAIQRNSRLIEEVLAEVKRIRTERGLPV